MPYQRNCGHAHGFPVCACFDGVPSWLLLARSRLLSSLAGWPALVTDCLACVSGKA